MIVAAVLRTVDVAVTSRQVRVVSRRRERVATSRLGNGPGRSWPVSTIQTVDRLCAERVLFKAIERIGACDITDRSLDRRGPIHRVGRRPLVADRRAFHELDKPPQAVGHDPETVRLRRHPALQRNQEMAAASQVLGARHAQQRHTFILVGCLEDKSGGELSEQRACPIQVRGGALACGQHADPMPRPVEQHRAQAFDGVLAEVTQLAHHEHQVGRVGWAAPGNGAPARDGNAP
jgi:hypothetical protein